MTRKVALQAFMPLSILTILILLFPQKSWAQGSTGTTITLDGSNCTVLYANNAVNNNWVYTYLRHNSVPIQLLNSNWYELADNGTGFFSSYANNMTIADGDISIYNLKSRDDCYIAIIAPQGYSISRYVLDINASETKVVNNVNPTLPTGAVIEEYTYTENNSHGVPIYTGNNITLSGKEHEILDVTKSGVNKLYFRFKFPRTGVQYQVLFNSLKITFTMDESFEVAIPNSEGTTEVHTGMVDLGEFSRTDNNHAWCFTGGNVTDIQDMAFFGEDSEGTDIETGTVKIDDEHYVWTIKNGTFYLEAPKIYRVTGGRLKFLSQEVTEVTEATEKYAENPSTATAGNKYVIGNGAYYLQLYLNNWGNYAFRRVSDKAEATVWTFSSDENGGFFIYSEKDSRYFTLNNNLGVSTDPSSWNYGTYGLSYKTTSYTYYLRYYNNSFRSTTSTNNANLRTPLYEYTYTAASTITHPASTYKAKVYGTDGEEPFETIEMGPDNNTEATVNVTGLNNDAIKFEISDLEADGTAFFQVAIDVMILDPYLQTIETVYLENNKEISEVSTSSENLKFNAGETIVVPIPGAMKKGDNDTYQIVFRNAYNENRNDTYTGTASGTGLSNYYIVGSPYEMTGSGSKVDANEAGTVELEATNIKKVQAAQASRLEDNIFSKTNAGYDEINLRNEETKTVYVYSVDKPNYILLPESRRSVEHVMWMGYEAKVMPYVVEEVPDIEVAEVSDIMIYNSTLKGANNKNSSIAKDKDIDTKHYFFGITVKAKKEDPTNTDEVKGILTSEQIITAVKNLLIQTNGVVDHLYSTDDPFRTILYLDMSYLNTVSDADGRWAEFRQQTADNCLYFMPKNYNQNSQNVIAGGKDGDGEAVGDIVIYDQQPFFSPYTFKTGTHTVTYERTGTNGKEATQHTTMILPFDIPLSAEGYLKTYSNQTDESVKFYTMSSVGEVDEEANVDTKVYTFNATAVTTGTATANTPYHIVSESAGGNSSYRIQLTGATFRPSMKSEVMNSTNETVTGYGSYNGVTVSKSDDVLYFSKEYFWRSSTLTNSNTVKILPFRAYYTTTEEIGDAKQLSIVFLDQEPWSDYKPTGISSHNANTGIKVNEGSISVTTDNGYRLRIFDIAGRSLIDDTLPANSSRSYALSKGIYIVNGKKVFVK